MCATTFRHLLLVSLLVTGSVSAMPAHGQGIAPGTRIRVTTADTRMIGHVRSSTADSVSMEIGNEGAYSLAWSDIDRVEHSLGMRGNAGRGALIGAGIASALTAGAIAFDSGDGDDLEGWGSVILVLVLPMNAAVGAGVGAVTGMMWRSERWSILPIARVSAGTPVGPGLTVTLRF